MLSFLESLYRVDLNCIRFVWNTGFHFISFSISPGGN